MAEILVALLQSLAAAFELTDIMLQFQHMFFGLFRTLTFRALCLFDSLARHELIAKLHLLRDLVNILCFCAALRTTNDLFQTEQFSLIVFSNPDV